MDTSITAAQSSETDQVAEIQEPPEAPVEATSDQAPSPLSSRLEEIAGLMKIISQGLDEVSTERRTQTSQKQWESLEEFKSETTDKPIKVWQKSLFARTYFVDKDLDDAFHNVMKYCSIFNRHLNSLSGKLQCRGDGLSDEPQESSSILPEAAAPTNESVFNESTGSEPRLPEIVNETSTSAESQQACSDEDIGSIQRSFIDLIRAKINFDSQFLNFNTVVSKNYYSEEFRSLLDLCSNSNVILERTSEPIDKQPPPAVQLSGDNSAVGTAAKRQKRKRLQASPADKTQRKRTRQQTRSARGSDEVQIIDSVRSRRHLR